MCCRNQLSLITKASIAARLIAMLILILAAVVFTTGCPRDSGEKEADSQDIDIGAMDTSESSDQIPIRLYFYDRMATVLVPVTRMVDKSLPYPKVIFDEMIEGPHASMLLARTIPEETQVISAVVDEDLLTLDLSREVVSYGGGSTYEIGLVLSLEHAAKQIPGVTRLQILIDGSKQDYLPEGTGIRAPMLVPVWVNNFDPAEDSKKICAYFVLRNTGYLVPSSIAAETPDELYKKLTDEYTYGGIYEAGLLDIEFSLREEKGTIVVSLDDSLMELERDKAVSVVKSLVFTVYSFVQSRVGFQGYRVEYNGEEVVTLFDVDLSMESCASSLARINSEELYDSNR